MTSEADVNRTESQPGQVQAYLKEEAATGGIEYEVDPDDIVIDPDIHALREWSGATEQELAIPELALAMSEEGQNEPCLVRIDLAEDALKLVDGERRLRAARWLREHPQREGDATFGLRILVRDLTPLQAFRAALLSFTQKRQQSPIEFARTIGVIRKKFEWPGSIDTQKVADFLCVSRATVVDAERLLTLPDVAVEAVRKGRMSKTAALQAASAPVTEQTAVYERAREHAKEDAAKGKGRGKKGKGSQARGKVPASGKAEAKAGASLPSEASAQPEPVPEPEPVVKIQHVRKAVKELSGGTVIKAPRMAEMLELVEQWDGPGYPDVMRRFVVTFCQWGHGKLASGEKGVTAAWDSIADCIDNWESLAEEVDAAGVAAGRLLGELPTGDKARGERQQEARQEAPLNTRARKSRKSAGEKQEQERVRQSGMRQKKRRARQAGDGEQQQGEQPEAS